MSVTMSVTTKKDSDINAVTMSLSDFTTLKRITGYRGNAGGILA